MLAALLLLAAQAAPAIPASSSMLRDLDTDRPDKTEGPHTVDAGHWQVELDLATLTTDRDGDVRTRTVNVMPINLRIGVGRNTEVDVIADSYIHQRMDDRLTNSHRSVDGFGDLTIRVKRNFWGNDGGKTAFGLIPFVKLPTNSNGVGNRWVEGGIIAPLAVTLSDSLDLGMMTEVDVLRKDDGNGYAATFVNSASLSGKLTEKLGLYGEVYSEIQGARDARLVATFDTGVTYGLSDNAQIDFGVNVGITDAADDLMLFVGVSRRF